MPDPFFSTLCREHLYTAYCTLYNAIRTLKTTRMAEGSPLDPFLFNLIPLESRGGQGRARQCQDKAGQGRARHGIVQEKAGQDGQGRAGQGNAGSVARLGKAGQGREGQGRAR